MPPANHLQVPAVVRLTLPLPPAVLRGNGRTRSEWMKRDAQRRAKMTGLALVREQYAHNPLCVMCKLNVRYTYYPAPRGKYPDDDNVISGMKYFRDGIAQGLGINDARFVTHPVERGERDGRGRVEVEIWEVTCN